MSFNIQDKPYKRNGIIFDFNEHESEEALWAFKNESRDTECCAKFIPAEIAFSVHNDVHDDTEFTLNIPKNAGIHLYPAGKKEATSEITFTAKYIRTHGSPSAYERGNTECVVANAAYLTYFLNPSKENFWPSESSEGRVTKYKFANVTGSNFLQDAELKPDKLDQIDLIHRTILLLVKVSHKLENGNKSSSSYNLSLPVNFQDELMGGSTHTFKFKGTKFEKLSSGSLIADRLSNTQQQQAGPAKNDEDITKDMRAYIKARTAHEKCCRIWAPGSLTAIFDPETLPEDTHVLALPQANSGIKIITTTGEPSEPIFFNTDTLLKGKKKFSLNQGGCTAKIGTVLTQTLLLGFPKPPTEALDKSASEIEFERKCLPVRQVRSAFQLIKELNTDKKLGEDEEPETKKSEVIIMGDMLLHPAENPNVNIDYTLDIKDLKKPLLKLVYRQYQFGQSNSLFNPDNDTISFDSDLEELDESQHSEAESNIEEEFAKDDTAQSQKNSDTKSLDTVSIRSFGSVTTEGEMLQTAMRSLISKISSWWNRKS